MIHYTANHPKGVSMGPMRAVPWRLTRGDAPRMVHRPDEWVPALGTLHQKGRRYEEGDEEA